MGIMRGNIGGKAMYIEYPVFFIKDLDKISLDEVNNILWFGLYKESLKVDYRIDEVIYYTLTRYYTNNQGNSVCIFIHQLNLEMLQKSGDAYSLSGEEICEFEKKVFKRFPRIKSDAIEYYQMSVVLENYHLVGHSETYSKNGKALFPLYKSEQLLQFDFDELLFLKNKLMIETQIIK